MPAYRVCKAHEVRTRTAAAADIKCLGSRDGNPWRRVESSFLLENKIFAVNRNRKKTYLFQWR